MFIAKFESLNWLMVPC